MKPNAVRVARVFRPVVGTCVVVLHKHVSYPFARTALLKAPSHQKSQSTGRCLWFVRGPDVPLLGIQKTVANLSAFNDVLRIFGCTSTPWSCWMRYCWSFGADNFSRGGFSSSTAEVCKPAVDDTPRWCFVPVHRQHATIDLTTLYLLLP